MKLLISFYCLLMCMPAFGGGLCDDLFSKVSSQDFRFNVSYVYDENRVNGRVFSVIPDFIEKYFSENKGLPGISRSEGMKKLRQVTKDINTNLIKWISENGYSDEVYVDEYSNIAIFIKTKPGLDKNKINEIFLRVHQQFPSLYSFSEANVVP